MNLEEHYEQMWLHAQEKFKQNQLSLDQQINAKDDSRRGVTLIIRPTTEVLKSISKFLNELKEIAPNQYIYPVSDIHITVMSIISCYEGFKLENIQVEEYIKIIKSSLKNLPVEEIHFKGTTASDAGIMIQGFPKNGVLDKLRDILRVNFRQSDLESSLDNRYQIKTAHSTILRFESTVKKNDEFLKLLNKYRQFNFGTFEVHRYEFVFNDWYQKKELTKCLDILNHN
ncbi:mutarotase [Pedobacter sp. SD-b]|uniref:Mutarotase n=1 Tax=Pedobacter segetis TaxID=2793069 RepID=A0ABS1BFJ8_9SPHI|nr:mutarotase [Pedobacter segetis]MBK0381632.1 mutarotase [Pedobacter segetis]